MIKNIHKGWFILILITLCILAALGFARFSFGAILPFMKNGLGLNYQQTGFLALSIFLGYLIAVLVAGHFVLKFKAKKVIVFSLFLVSTGMVLTANADSFSIAFIGCFIIGVASGGIYVPSLGLLGQWFTNKSKGMAMGIAMAGSGGGMVFSGVTVPILIAQTGMNGWRISWYILAILVLIIAVTTLLFLKNKPEDLGLKAISRGQDSILIQELRNANLDTNVYRNKTMWHLGLIYSTYGISYLVFSTFLVDYLIADVGFTNSSAGTFFAIAGITSIISGFIWGSLSDRFGRLVTLMIVFFIQSILLLTFSFSSNSTLILLTTALYGITLWAVPTIINASVSDYIHPKFTTIGMGFVTVFLGIGQLVSPAIIGYLIEYSNSYFTAFLFSSIIALFGALGCIRLLLTSRKRAEQSELEIPLKSIDA